MQIDRASRFLQTHSLKKNSLCRSCALLLLDLALFCGFFYVLYRVITDQEYWRSAPYPFHVFIVAQYAMLALLIRVPIMSCRAVTTGWIVCSLSFVVILNAMLGLFWLH